MKLAWTGTDGDSGVAGYDLEQRIDGGGWTALTTNTRARSVTLPLNFGHTYDVRVRATDGSGNVGVWVQGAPILLSGFSERSARIAYRGNWRDARSASFQGGADRYATTSTARATFRFVGRSVEWVSAIGPTRGTARIFVDGIYVGTVNLHAVKSGARRIVWSRSWSSAGTHTVVIRVGATSGHPRTDLDTLVVLN